MQQESKTNTSMAEDSRSSISSVGGTESRSRWQKTYGFLGFGKAYNFILFFIFAGAMLGFSLARISYVNISGSSPSSYANGAAPGEWYWFREGVYRVGITMHLVTILPAGLLMGWQFVPIIRHKFILFHRINGYLIILLVLVGNVGALLCARRAFGGGLDTQAGVGMLAILTTTSIVLAYYNIKRLQIEQHRAWMLRTMFYLGTIITTRLIMIIAAQVVSAVQTYYTVMSCEEIKFIYGSWNDELSRMYPQCKDMSSLVAVHADFPSGLPDQIAASFRINFGMALWMALILHLVGVEIYLALTPREHQRLRQVSYERQMERGFKNPGSAGLTSDRLGDAESWQPMK